MSWVRVWVHMVFSTLKREPFLNENIRTKVFNHIKENAIKKDIWIEAVNGYSDHVHCLISINKEQSISQVAQFIKGESSWWINQNKLTNTKFRWQNDYWAVSVSESHVNQTRSYINRQEAHHNKKSFDEEVSVFMNRYGWQ